ncbi:hypothetical protein NQ318_012375 [Aromia moschata]|uniref:Uncharacterized protein n=1 Tax=Aromia moschata TaxID=1265417 RepID=A0AAV8Y2J4_9CUCU|nr:hypothetical protein NQ318_012375 [Aromia moschata]
MAHPYKTIPIASIFLQGHAHYKFEYGVHDPHSKDLKYQHEHRDGKHLTGGYGLKEPDGTHRVVKYRASPHTGFEAVVARHGHAKHPPCTGSTTRRVAPEAPATWGSSTGITKVPLSTEDTEDTGDTGTRFTTTQTTKNTATDHKGGTVAMPKTSFGFVVNYL